MIAKDPFWIFFLSIPGGKNKASKVKTACTVSLDKKSARNYWRRIGARLALSTCPALFALTSFSVP